MPLKRKLLAAAVMAMVLGSSSLAQGVGEKAADMLGLIGIIYKGLTMASEQSQLVNIFIKNSKNCVVITNKTSAPWKFGYLANYQSELSGTQSGTFTVQTVSGDLKTWNDLGPLGPDGAAVDIHGRYGAVVLKLGFVKTGLASWQNFFRVCYLEDGDGHRIYLNVTAPGTLTASVPQVGLASASQADVMRDRGDPMAEKILSIYAASGVKEKRLQALDMIAIGQPTVK